jgi:hypothetical protein
VSALAFRLSEMASGIFGHVLNAPAGIRGPEQQSSFLAPAKQFDEFGRLLTLLGRVA